METRTVFTIWYRSVLEDGSVWCESRDLGEVMARSIGQTATIQEYTTYLVEGGWKTIGEVESNVD